MSVYERKRERERENSTPAKAPLLILLSSSAFPLQRFQLEQREGVNTLNKLLLYTHDNYTTASLTSFSTIFNLPSASLAASYIRRIKKKKSFHTKTHTHTHLSIPWPCTHPVSLAGVFFHRLRKSLNEALQHVFIFCTCGEGKSELHDLLSSS